jgi:polar amino acid transport system permease protein
VRAATDFRYPEAYGAALVYYLAIVSVLMVVQARLEKRFTWSSVGRRRRVVPAVAHDAR